MNSSLHNCKKTLALNMEFVFTGYCMHFVPSRQGNIKQIFAKLLFTALYGKMLKGAKQTYMF